MVTVEIDGEAISEPWVMQGGVPKHDVAHCCKPAGLMSADAQSKSHQMAHTLACIKRHATKTRAAAAAAEAAAAKELSTTHAKAATAAAAQAKQQEDDRKKEERREKRVRDLAQGKPLDLSEARQTGMGAFFLKLPKPAAGLSPAAAAAAAAAAAVPPPAAAAAGSPPAATASPPTAADGTAAISPLGGAPAPASAEKPAGVEQTGDAFDRSLMQHFESFEVSPPPEGTSPEAVSLFLAAAVKAHAGLLRHCPGYTIDVGGPVATHYPFALHATQMLPWSMPGTNGVVHACGQQKPCSDLVALAPGAKEAAPCSACAELPSLVKLTTLQAQAKDMSRASSTTHDVHLSHEQMRARRDAAVERASKANLGKFNSAKAAKVATKFRDGAQRVFQLLADHKMPRLHQLFRQALARGATPQKLQELLGRCARGEYAPKGYDEEDLDSLLLVQRLGGGRLTYALNKSHGVASRSLLYKGGKLPRFLICPAELELNIVRQNMETFIFSQPCKGRTLWTLMADNVAVEERWRYAQHRDCIYGGCREHTPGGKPLFFKSAQDAINLKAMVGDGKIHLAKEALVAALASNAKESYSCRPIVAQGSCKKDECWKQHGRVLEARPPPCPPHPCSLPSLSCSRTRRHWCLGHREDLVRRPARLHDAWADLQRVN